MELKEVRRAPPSKRSRVGFHFSGRGRGPEKHLETLSTATPRAQEQRNTTPFTYLPSQIPQITIINPNQ